MRTTRDDIDRSERWPPERFYWAVIEGSNVPGRRGRRETALAYLAENVFPVALEELHVAFAPLGVTATDPAGTGRVVVCAAPREALHEALTREALSVRPERAPAFLEEVVAAEGLAQLELLHGAFEPKRLAAARGRLIERSLLVVAVALVLLAVGFFRRADQVTTDVTATLSARDALVAEALPADPNSPLPPELRLLAEVRRLEEAQRVASTTSALRRDAAIDLAAVVARWPRTATAGGAVPRLETVSVADDTITVRATVPSSADAEPLSAALSSVPGWTLEQPQFRSNDDSVSVTILLRRAKEGS